jgi:photosystem II stability/assembly factor-like uncharacterized protein
MRGGFRRAHRSGENAVMKKIQLSALLFALGATIALAQSPQQEPYSWKNVQIVGGGFVDGVIFHPTASGVRYARTDMGGAYRWDEAAKRWQPILDWVPYKDYNLMGVESIAVDPADANRVYLACGTYTNKRTPNGAILRSDDSGRSFQRTNEDCRGNGERLAVDPQDGRILYLGTRHDGLWRSQDRGASWMRIASFPNITEATPPTPNPVPGETPEEHWRHMPVHGDGIVFVKFAAQKIYVGVSLMNRPNLFASTDGGASWREVESAPTKYRPTRAALSADGFLYVAYGTAPGASYMTDGAVWKLDTRSGAWTDITPDRPVAGSKEFGYAAVSVDVQHPGTLIASSFGRPYSAGSEDIFRSTDGGASWKTIFGTGGVYDYSLAPYVQSTPIHWLFDIEIDPVNSNHAVFTTGYGGWETFDLTAADHGQPTHWSILSTGIEETVPLDMNSPNEGAHLITGIGDYGSFVHWDLDHPEPEGASAPPRMHNTSGVASATLRPEVLVRVGNNAEGKADENIGFSLDAGHTWKPTPATPKPGSHAGFIAVSADGNTWIWTPEDEAAYVTHDMGATWAAAQGLPADLRVIADPVAARQFYSISFAHRTLYSSSDGGATFSARRFKLPGSARHFRPDSRGDIRGGQDRIYAAPGSTADLWLPAFDGLYHAQLSSKGGVSFLRLPNVEEIHAFGFGKAAPHESYPALYLAGTIHDQPGIFRSTDEAKTWVRINDDQHQWGLILQLTGDPRLYGRVYVGIHGRGVFYGDPTAR